MQRLRSGGEYRYGEFPQIGNEFPSGQFTNTISASAQTGGYSGADLLMGDMDNSIIPRNIK